MEKKGKKPDWDAVVKEKVGEKNYYTKIGVAWLGENGRVTIRFREHISVGGSLVLYPVEEEQREETASRETPKTYKPFGR